MTRSVGRQAQIIPTLTSMFDQSMTFTWSHVGLAEAAKVTSDWRRRHETIVTLIYVSLGLAIAGRDTYKVPTRNMMATLIFLRHESCSLKTS